MVMLLPVGWPAIVCTDKSIVWRLRVTFDPIIQGILWVSHKVKGGY